MALKRENIFQDVKCPRTIRHRKLDKDVIKNNLGDIPIEIYNSTFKLYASRSELRNISCTKARISKHHILEMENTGKDIFYKIMDTNIGLKECDKDIENNINFCNIIPIISPILEKFKQQHNIFEYNNELKCIMNKEKKKLSKQQYKDKIPIYLLKRFFNFVLYKNVPLQLFGTRKNFKSVKRTVHWLLKISPKKLLINTRSKKKLNSQDYAINKVNKKKTFKTTIGGLLNIKPLLQKLDVFEIEWLRPLKDVKQKWIIILKLLHWFFAQYIIKILHKYIVLIPSKQQWLYILKDDWCQIQRTFINEKVNKGDFLLNQLMSGNEKIYNILHVNRLTASSSGLRIIAKCNYEKTSFKIEVIMRFLQQLYSTYINENGFSTVRSCTQQIYNFKKSSTGRLYYIQCDIQDAFGSIQQQKLLDIIKNYCKEHLPIYLILRQYKKQCKNMKNTQKRQQVNKRTVQFLEMKNLEFRSIGEHIAEKPQLVNWLQIISFMKKLLLQKKIILYGKVYSIKTGVPQGLRLSPIFSEIYYQDMFNKLFSEFKNNGLLCRYVDDILYVTDNKNYAEQFLKMIRNDIPEYNVKFNPNKIQTNIELPSYKHTTKQFDTSTTAEDNSYFSSELDLLNPRVTRSCRRSRLVRATTLSNNEANDPPNLLESPSSRSPHRCQRSFVDRKIAAKLLTEGLDDIAALRSIAPIGSSASVCERLKNYEPQVTFEKRHPGDGEGFDRELREKLWRLMYCGDNKQESSTPKIVRVIRQNSRKRDLKADRSAASDRPREDNSKSSVVVLYHGRSSTPASSTSTKVPVRLSRSDETVAATTSRPETANSASPDKAKVVETPETQSPRYPLPRRKLTSRRHRRVSRQQPSLHVNIYHESQVERLVSALQRPWIVSEKQIGEGLKSREFSCTAESSRAPVESQQRTSENATRSRRPQKQVGRKQCSQTEVLKSMDYYPRQVETNDTRGLKQAAPCSNLSSSIQRTQTHLREANPTFISVNEGDEASRVFPFRATPSGNLKIIPNQVVFESKKFSVLVADPRRTRVNVKAELSRPDVDVGAFVPDSINREKYVDLPPGITSSTIDQLQAQKKLPYVKENYKSRAQSSAKFIPSEMAEREPAQSATYQLPAMNEVPLASLGFTNEQPINWENIILPEKTDLYQELAKRITNYKNADCVIRIDHDEFYCHLLVLQSYSSFFDEKNRKDIDLSGTTVTSKAFSIIYDWMISSTNESYHLLRRDNILEIFMASQYLGIKELEEQCWAFIDNDELFSEDTAFLLYLEAKKIGNTAVMELMVPRIMRFFLMLVSTKDFLELSVDELCLLLKSNYICVNSEMEVLMSAVRWLMHDWNERKQHMLEVLKCVRFGLIAPWQLVDVKRNPENPEFMELMSYSEVQKMVDDGLAFVIIKYWYGNQTEDYYHWIDLLGLSEPTNRNWAGEDKNYVTYREFLMYLEEYQKTKVTELKVRKTSAKPTPPNSPPKDFSPLSPGRMHADCGQNHCFADSRASERYSATQNRGSMKYMTKVTTSSGILIPPEILTECLGSMGRSNNSKEQCDGNRNGRSVGHEIKFHGAGESPRRSMDFFKRHMSENRQNCEDQQGRNVSDVYSRKQWDKNATHPMKKQQKVTKKSRYSENRADSVKSEEEAATMIQATYRGYKVRRKFDEIKKSSSEEKQNAQKVAELLSATTSRCDWFFQKRPTKPSQSVQ